MKHTKIKIDGCNDRDTMVAILAKNGYKVWIEKEDVEFYPLQKNYYVNFQ